MDGNRRADGVVAPRRRLARSCDAVHARPARRDGLGPAGRDLLPQLCGAATDDRRHRRRRAAERAGHAAGRRAARSRCAPRRNARPPRARVRRGGPRAFVDGRLRRHARLESGARSAARRRGPSRRVRIFRPRLQALSDRRSPRRAIGARAAARISRSNRTRSSASQRGACSSAATARASCRSTQSGRGRIVRCEPASRIPIRAPLAAIPRSPAACARRVRIHLGAARRFADAALVRPGSRHTLELDRQHRSGADGDARGHALRAADHRVLQPDAAGRATLRRGPVFRPRRESGRHAEFPARDQLRVARPVCQRRRRTAGVADAPRSAAHRRAPHRHRRDDERAARYSSTT